MDRPARYRAPTASGQKLVVPPWEEMADEIAASRAWRAASKVRLLGRPLADVAAAARVELMAKAAEYGATFGSVAAARSADAERPLIVTGHQPGLSHPGVWLKNFAAARQADAVGGRALHIVIDADVCRATSVLAPAGSVEAPHAAQVSFDRPATAQPWEERRILDERVWRSFPEELHATSGGMLANPMLDQWWPLAIERGQATGSIAASLSQARKLAEERWGVANLELPQSLLCQSKAFRWFLLHLLGDLPRFAEAHNEALQEYRRAHRIRNHAHPAPNLSIRDGWFEAPLWMWSSTDPRRRPVFVRIDHTTAAVRAGDGFTRKLPLGAGRADDALAELAKWEAAGFKLRSRALLTTLFTRMVVADLFIHGIGGAKYDEATDAISARFLGESPPRYAVVSGTLRLPIAHPPGDEHTVAELSTKLREFRFHPERWLGHSELPRDSVQRARALAREKRRLIDAEKTHANAAARHDALLQVNTQLAALLSEQRAGLIATLEEARGRVRANRILDSREYSFCLFPRNNLKQFLLDFDPAAR